MARRTRSDDRLASGRIGFQQLMAFCRASGICPGLIPRKSCVENFKLLSSYPPQDKLWSMDGLQELESFHEARILARSSLTYSDFINWLILVALTSDGWLGMETCNYPDTAVRLRIFFGWFEASCGLHRTKAMAGTEGLQWRRPDIEYRLLPAKCKLFQEEVCT